MMSSSAQTKASGDGGQVLHMHHAHPDLSLPYMTPGDLKASAQELTSRVPGLPGRGRLPAVPGSDLLFYGGLGALTVAGALEWPIAVAIGGATYVVRGRTRGETHEGQGAAPRAKKAAAPRKSTTTRRRGTTAQKKS
ncbi:hypothetical protein IM697_32355 [Streptomyces ferrugineus]|uniref:Uncharacterized protein n=1 Tax=Streptomyces ferrugineus TaxID=1413221 RepID=A0A7M2SEL5_9ACTN|nr:hypothetical protein [Streptomyces ferrugineus]QOV34762.1 hypothetical protein IM697_32355 [Streptomyces ferrugineus]